MNIENISGSYSKGNQTKFISEGYFYKEDMMGYESISEVLVSELLSYTSGVSFIDYLLEEVHYEGKIMYCCKSKVYTSEGESFVSLYRLLQIFNGVEGLKRTKGRESVDYVIDFVKRTVNLDIHKYLSQMIILDAIILNEDRHLNNICFIYRNGVYKVAPLFDNGLSLLSDLNDYPLDGNILRLIRKVKAKPFSTSFSTQVGYFPYFPLVIDYEGFYSKLEKVEENLSGYVPFKQKEYHRAKAVLLRRLRETEGKLWVKK